eukprot:CAMPEP_0184670070 /NCGR_PEP_ID=MMETSP0308-20130426/80434_1 /TAXON_ID=38269 /ORGANISM="Gloeochaete witrockiana, Strain SAG 46.84" /LENGTH=233 /DNA_ID=CAMNT_0027116643 /DNA_START=304 /DNA_END=1003 /DNA_ORIENTATION=+
MSDKDKLSRHDKMESGSGILVVNLRKAVSNFRLRGSGGESAELALESNLHSLKDLLDRTVNEVRIASTKLCNLVLNNISEKIDDRGRERSVYGAIRLVEFMIDHNIDVTMHTINTALSICVKARMAEMCEPFLKLIHDRKINFKCDLVTYNILMNAAIRLGSADEAVAIFRRAEEKGFKPDHVSYGTIIKAYVQYRNTAKAMEWLLKMSKNGIVPSESDVVLVIKGFLWANDW